MPETSIVDRRISFEAAKFAVNREQRTLTGTLLPFDVTSRPSLNPQTGQPALWHFAAGTVTVPEDPTDVVLNYGHDDQSLYMQVGAAATLSVQPDGVQAVFRIARTPEGDRVLALAEDKVLKSFSAEVEGEFDSEDSDTPGMALMRAKTASVIGAAVVRRPAFVGAQITSVAASAAPNKENSMTDTIPETEAATPSFSKADGDKLMGDIQRLNEKLAELEKIKLPVGPGSAQFQVAEEPIYRFGGDVGAPSGFDFAEDLLKAAKDGDQAAFDRVKKFSAQRLVGARFADQPTTTGDVAAINPSQYRPDMFLGQAPVPASPLYDFFHKGGLSNVTPFFYSKLDRATTDVGIGDHVEGTDPESRDLVTAVGATITPTPVSGRVHITREVGDQGGNPNVSGLVWSEFERSLSIALETKTAALVLAAAMSELDAAIAAGATGTVAGSAVEAGLVGLQFLADGFRFERVFGHIDLYKALAAATKGADNADKLYPIINPQSTSGQAASKWSHLDIGGYGMYPAASLGATDVNQKSVVADPMAVHVWNSGLQRLDKLQEKVEGWDVGAFAYFAGIVYDVTGLRKITYDKSA